MTTRDYVLTSLFTCVAVLIGIGIGRTIAQKDAIKMYQQELIAKTKSNTMKPFTTNAHFETADNAVDLDVRVSETPSAMKYELNGKTLYWDKNTLFGEECRNVFTNFSENDIQTTKHMVIAYYIYKYRDLFADWCVPTGMNNYLLDVEARFGRDYKESINYLNSKTGNKAEKCILQPIAQSRKNYEFAEFDAFYSEVKQYMGLGNIFTKADLCNMLNDSPEMRTELLKPFQDAIQKLRTTDISAKFTDKH